MTAKFCFMDKLRDKASGCEGRIIAIVKCFGRSVQYGLQPASKDGSMPDVFTVDEAQLELVEKSDLQDRVPFTEVLYGGGDVVKCNVTGAQGKVVSVTEFLNGCLRYSVQRKANKEGRVPDPLQIYEVDLKLVERAKVKAPERTTGGATERLARERG